MATPIYGIKLPNRSIFRFVKGGKKLHPEVYIAGLCQGGGPNSPPAPPGPPLGRRGLERGSPPLGGTPGRHPPHPAALARLVHSFASLRVAVLRNNHEPGCSHADRAADIF